MARMDLDRWGLSTGIYLICVVVSLFLEDGRCGVEGDGRERKGKERKLLRSLMVFPPMWILNLNFCLYENDTRFVLN